MTEQLQNRGDDSDRCAWPRCREEGMTIFSPGAMPHVPFRAAICDRHLGSLLSSRSAEDNLQQPREGGKE